MKKLACLLMTTSLLTLGMNALAQDDAAATAAPATPVAQQHQNEWKGLTPAQKEVKRQELRQKIKNMTPEEREKYKAERKAQWQERYDRATPEKKAQMDKRMEERKAKRQERNVKRMENVKERNAKRMDNLEERNGKRIENMEERNSKRLERIEQHGSANNKTAPAATPAN